MSKTSFKELINSEKPVLIEYSAEWCGPCKQMKPILKSLAKKIGNEARILKIDVDKNRTLAQRMGIRGVPTFAIYKRGKELWKQSGMQSEQQLLNLLNQYK